jgi:hypothetical protein
LSLASFFQPSLIFACNTDTLAYLASSSSEEPKGL